MISIVKKAFLAGLGAVSLTKEKTESFIEEMTRKGEISREEAGSFLDELVERGQEGRENINKMIQSELTKFKKSHGIITRDELQNLMDRLEGIEKALRDRE
ncbi:MAG: hypothetical protein GX318_01635 [Clostridia bacterium]|nr:hypothetical protein [Clostridia bacterium]